jgi:hypothetical protein
MVFSVPKRLRLYAPDAVLVPRTAIANAPGSVSAVVLDSPSAAATTSRQGGRGSGESGSCRDGGGGGEDRDTGSAGRGERVRVQLSAGPDSLAGKIAMWVEAKVGAASVKLL